MLNANVNAFVVFTVLLFMLWVTSILPRDLQLLTGILMGLVACGCVIGIFWEAADKARAEQERE